MSRSLRHGVISLFIVLAWGSGWLMLWTLGFYLTHNGQQAALFLPHGVYLALVGIAFHQPRDVGFRYAA